MASTAAGIIPGLLAQRTSGVRVQHASRIWRGYSGRPPTNERHGLAVAVLTWSAPTIIRSSCSAASVAGGHAGPQHLGTPAPAAPGGGQLGPGPGRLPAVPSTPHRQLMLGLGGRGASGGRAGGEPRGAHIWGDRETGQVQSREAERRAGLPHPDPGQHPSPRMLTPTEESLMSRLCAWQALPLNSPVQQPSESLLLPPGALKAHRFKNPFFPLPSGEDPAQSCLTTQGLSFPI